MRMRGVMALALLLPVATAGAATYLLLPDGTGDFPDIQSALDAAVDGDVIELGDGVFSGAGSHDLDYLGKAVTVHSRGGDPNACIVDLTGSGGFLFGAGEGAGSVLEGLTIVNGYRHDGGGAVVCLAASPTLRDCVFEGNEGYNGGGGVLCFGGANPAIESCRFRDNLSVLGGGLCCLQASAPAVSGCVFSGNTGTYGGAVAAYDGSAPVLTDCRIDGNHAWAEGGALYAANGAQPGLLRCTLWGNTAPGTGTISLDAATLSLAGCTAAANEGDAFLRLGASASADLDHAIVAFQSGGAAVLCEGGAVTLACCDLFGSSGGDWVECIAAQSGQSGNLAVDPGFCDAAGFDFTLHESSPCGPGNPTCGLMGAWPVGCGPTPVEDTSWGALKDRFRR
jgi:hypothetical protein